MKVVTTQQKLSEDRNESFWYKGDIAHVKLENGNTVYVEATGEIRIKFHEDDVHWKGIKAQEKAKDLNLTDEGLGKLVDSDLIDMCNWFRLIEVDANGDCVGDEFDLDGNYDDAIASLNEYILEMES